MIRQTLFAFFMLTTTLAFSQTSSTKIAIPDSADFFLQKGLLEKQNGRRLESLKNFEKAEKFDANNKAIESELAFAYLDLDRKSVV